MAHRVITRIKTITGGLTVKHQQDKSVTEIQTPFGSVTLIAATHDRVLISTGGRGRERLLRVHGRSVRAEFQLCLRHAASAGGLWKVSESVLPVLFETADGGSVPAATRALVIRTIIPIVAVWAAAHPDVLLMLRISAALRVLAARVAALGEDITRAAA
jgi:hypothetical protein